MKSSKCFSKYAVFCLLSMCVSIADLQAWTAPQQISTNDSSACPSIAMDSSGNIAAVWLSGVSPNLSIQAANYSTVSSTWSGATNIAPVGLYHTPSVSMSPSGTATFMWARETNNYTAIESIRLPLGGSWGQIKVVTQSGNNINPVQGVDSSGIVTAAWFKNDTLIAARTASNGNWGSPVNVYSGGGNSDAQVSVNSSGNVLLTWYNAGKNTSLASSFINNAWTTAVQIDPQSSGSNNTKAQVSLNDSGNAIAVWSDFINGIKSKSNTVYSQPWTQSMLYVTHDHPNSQPQVKIGSNNTNAVSVWLNNNIGTIMSSNLVSGAWSTPVVICNSYNNDSPKLLLDGSFNARAVWNDIEAKAIKTSRQANGGFWSYPPTEISTSGYNAGPMVAGNSSGKSAVAWIHNVGNNNVIQASINAN